MYKSSMKVIDSSLNIVIPERPEDSVQGYDAQMESYRNASHKVGSAGRRGPTQIVRPHTSRTPRKFTHKSSLYGNTGKRNENSLLRMDDRGFEGHQQAAASDRDQTCIHVTQMQKLKDPLLIKR